MTISQISGSYNSGITLSSASFADPVTVTGTGSITVTGSTNALSAATSWTIDNEGKIAAAAGEGVDLTADGALTNSGAISSTSSVGVFLASGTVTNTGSITGKTDAIVIAGAGGTIENFGTIIGGIAFEGAGSNRVIVDGGLFKGTATAAGTGNTFEVAGNRGSAAGTINGLGSTVTGFQTIQFDKGGSWTISGSLAGVTELAGFHYGDAIDLTGITYQTGETVSFNTTTDVLHVLSGTSQVLWSVNLVNILYQPYNYAGFTFSVAKDKNGDSIVTVAPSDIPPTIDVPGAQSVTDGTTADIAGVSMVDAQAGWAKYTFQVTLTDKSGDLFVTKGGRGKVAGDGTIKLTLTGNINEVDGLLKTLTYTGTKTGTDTITINASDGRGGNATPGTISVTVDTAGADARLARFIEAVSGENALHSATAGFASPVEAAASLHQGALAGSAH